MAATLQEKIEDAFAGRVMPAATIEPEQLLQYDSDVEEAEWFKGRDWHDLTWQDWQQHWCAITYFSPEAFAYYLPSLLLLSMENPTEDLLAVDTLMFKLDVSPCVEGWPEGFTRVFLQFRSAELDVLKEWLLFMCDYPTYSGYGISGSGPGDRFGLAFEAVGLLQREIERKRCEDARIPESPMDRT